jgi:murein DD-endopeptidase MepM/ murein hydrolase activator NlpD
MRKSYYTLLVIPQKESSIRKISVSSDFLKFISFAMAIGLLSLVYFSYDYVKLKGEIGELTKLRRLSAVQKKHIDILDSKVAEFGKKMTELEQFDKKIRIITNLEDEREDGELLGMGGPIPEEKRIEEKIADKEKVIIGRVYGNVDQLLAEVNYQKESFKELLEFLTKQKSVLAKTPSIWPVKGWVTSEFGYRISPFTGMREFHRGIDIATRIGKEIVAPAYGTVIKTSKDAGMGNEIRIDHGNGIVTSYGHLLKFAVKKGQRINRGDVIGYVGNSGRSTGPHLHYGVQVKGIYVNPRRHLF